MNRNKAQKTKKKKKYEKKKKQTKPEEQKVTHTRVKRTVKGDIEEGGGGE